MAITFSPLNHNRSNDQEQLIATAVSDLPTSIPLSYCSICIPVYPVVMYDVCNKWELDVFLSGVDMSESEYSQLHAAMEKLNTEAAKMAENQKSLLSHNAQVVHCVEDFRTVQQNFKKTSGKPSALSQPDI